MRLVVRRGFFARAARVGVLSLASLTALVDCNAIIGTRDLTYSPRVGADGGDAATAADDSALPETDAADASPDLDAELDATCSSNPLTDRKNCGRCGHDCLGGACADGACKPVTLASGQGQPLGITLLNGYVYWTNHLSHEVRRARTDGTDQSLFAQNTAEFRRPSGIVTDGVAIYFAAIELGTGGVFACPASDCNGAALRRISSKSSHDVGIRGGTAYYTSILDGTLSRASITGAGETAISTINTPFQIAVDATHAYLTSNENDIVRVPLGGGIPESVGSNRGDLAGGIFVDDARVYWTYTFYTKPGVILARDKATGVTTGYTNTARNPTNVIADSKLVYWITLGTSEQERERNDGKLFACPIAGCPSTGPLLLADGLENGIGLALDDAAIYYTEIGLTGIGAVRKIAKP